MAENYESHNNDFVEIKSDYKSIKPSENVSGELQKRKTTEEQDTYSKDDVIQRENEVSLSDHIFAGRALLLERKNQNYRGEQGTAGEAIERQSK